MQWTLAPSTGALNEVHGIQLKVQVFRVGIEMATGVGWDFVRVDCLSLIKQTCT